MLKRRFFNFCGLFFLIKKTTPSSSLHTKIQVTAAEASDKHAFRLLYHHQLRNGQHGSRTDKNANGQDWIIN